MSGSHEKQVATGKRCVEARVRALVEAQGRSLIVFCWEVVESIPAHLFVGVVREKTIRLPIEEDDLVDCGASGGIPLHIERRIVEVLKKAGFG
jgi:hypothetical protein